MKASVEKNLARGGHSAMTISCIDSQIDTYFMYLGLMSEYVIKSDNCYKRRKAGAFSQRERKIQNRKYTTADEQTPFNQSDTYPSA